MDKYTLVAIIVLAIVIIAGGGMWFQWKVFQHMKDEDKKFDERWDKWKM